MKKEIPLLFFILLLGFALRFTACGFGLPHLYHADEPIVVNHALAFGSGDLNPHFFKIPPLVSYLLFGVYGLFFALGHWMGKFPNPQAFEFLFYSDPSHFYLLARVIFGVFAGTLTLLVFYRLIARHFSVRTALIGTALLAVNFLHVRDSHYIYADIPLILVMLSAFLVFFRLPERPGTGSHLWSGAMIGLAAAVKYNGAALVIPYLFLAAQGPSSAGKKAARIASAGMISAVVFILLNPYSILDFSYFYQELQKQALSNSGVPWSHHLRYSLAGGLGIPLLALALPGIAGLIFKFNPKKTTIALFVLGYYCILVRAGQPYDRYVLPLIPFLIFFAADFISLVSEKGRHPAITILLFLAAFLPNLAKSVLFDRLMLAPDTRTLAREWSWKHVPQGDALALDWDFYMPRLSFSKTQLKEKVAEIAKNPGFFSATQKRRLDFLLEDNRFPGHRLYFMNREVTKERFLFASPSIAYDLRELRAAGIKYVVIVRLHSQAGPPWFYEQIVRGAKKVGEFSPYRNEFRKIPYDFQPLTGGPFLWEELWHRERNGQPLEIYRIDNVTS